VRNKRNVVVGIASAIAAGALFVPLTGAYAGHTNTVLTADLRGRNEVPAEGERRAGDRNGRGEVYVFGIDDDPKTLCYVLTVERIEPATAAHIHRGVEGVNGPVVANLAAPADGDAADCLTEGEAGKFVGGQTVADILANPENFYVNVHNAEHPGGAIRGQLQAHEE
jgi:hypothetical protein